MTDLIKLHGRFNRIEKCIADGDPQAILVHPPPNLRVKTLILYHSSCEARARLGVHSDISEVQAGVALHDAQRSPCWKAVRSLLRMHVSRLVPPVAIGSGLPRWISPDTLLSHACTKLK
jgi:hypothetical protein